MAVSIIIHCCLQSGSSDRTGVYGQVIKTDGCFYKAGLDTKFYCFIWYLQFSPEVFFWMSFFCNPCTFWEYMSVYSQFFYGTEIIPELRSGLNTAENSVI